MRKANKNIVLMMVLSLSGVSFGGRFSKELKARPKSAYAKSSSISRALKKFLENYGKSPLL